MSLLQTLIFIENIFGVYRNYLFFNNLKKTLVIVRFVLEISIAVVAVIINIKVIDSLYESSRSNELISIAYQAVLLLKLTLVLGSALRCSEPFTVYYKNVKAIHKSFKNDPCYIKSNKMLNTKCVAIAVLFIMAATIMAIWGVIDTVKESSKWQNSIVFTSILWIDSRFILEHLVAFCAITKIKDFLVIVNKSVEEALQHFTNKEISPKDENPDTFDVSKRVKTWTNSYQQILVCAQQVSLSFNDMSVVSIGVVVFYIVTVIYQLLNTVLNTSAQPVDTFTANNMLYMLAYHIAGNIALIVSGQGVKAEVEILDKKLARLILKVSTHCPKPEARQIKDVYRLVCTSPIVIQANKYPLGIYILPVILSMSATYIVVMLQINHVV